MLSEGATWLRKEACGQRHLAVINEVTFPTALAGIEKNLSHFKVTSTGEGSGCGVCECGGMGVTTGWSATDSPSQVRPLSLQS